MTARSRPATIAGAAMLAMVCLGAVAADLPPSATALAAPTSTSAETTAAAVTAAVATAAAAASAAPQSPGVDPASVPADPLGSTSPAAPLGEVAADTGTFSLAVSTAQGELIATSEVDPLSPPPGALVEPPDYARSVWVEQSTPPASDAPGTTYIYGHACLLYECAFTPLTAAGVGDLVVLSTDGGQLVYRITDRGQSSKATNALPAWAMDPTVPARVVLVTCAYEPDGTSVDNLVFAANLISATAA